MCRVAVRAIAASAMAPAQTRRWAADQLRRWDLGTEVDRTLLVLNELVTNAVVHSPGAAACRITVDAGCIEVVVSDDGPGPSRRARRAAAAPDPDADEWGHTGGRGLRIVAACADGWGTAFLDGRAAVWARWPLTREWQHGAACACNGTDGVRLGSGGRAVAVAGPWDEGPAAGPPMSSDRRVGRTR